MDVPIGAQVYCENELCGCSTHVILNPMTNKVTHIVVQQEGPPFAGYIVPIEWLEASSPNQLVLHCRKDELAKRKHLQAGSVSSNPVQETWDSAYTLPHELAVKQGAWVEARDGYAGLVDEFLIDPRTWYVTHVVLREAHLWGKEGIAVPISAVSCIEEHRVRLRLNIDGVQRLPPVPTRQHSTAGH
jgi:hypothetical protein